MPQFSGFSRSSGISPTLASGSITASSATKNSLVADGCIIDGRVENCIIFKGVKVEKGAVVKNSILMQDTVVGENSKVNCVITDKNVSIRSSAELSGAETFPVCLVKNTKV